jgi:hypothetical protein
MQTILANGKLDPFSVNSVSDDAIAFKKLSFIASTGIPHCCHHSITETGVTSTMNSGLQV